MRILQARILEWVVMSSSRGSSQPRSPELQADSWLEKKKKVFLTTTTKKLPCPPPRDLSNPGMELGFPALQANSLPTGLPGSPYCNLSTHKISRKINYNIKEETINFICTSMCVCVLSRLSYPTLCDPMDCSPPGSSVHRISEARIPAWVAISSPWGSSPPRDQTRAPCTCGRILHHWATWEATHFHV